MCCTLLAGNTGRKNRYFGTIVQLCRAISSELMHVSTIGKNLLNSNTSSTCPDNMVNLRPTNGWDLLPSLGHPCKFQRVSRLSSVTARHSSSGRQPNCGVEQRAPPIFGRAAITLGIGPHSSSYYLGLLSVQRQPVTNTTSVTDTCGFNNSID